MTPIWRQKWQNLGRKRVQSGLFARSSTVTLRGTAILPSFGFGRFGHLPRREGLENEPHFLRFRFSQLVNTIQTKLTSFMCPYPRALLNDIGPSAGQFSPSTAKQSLLDRLHFQAFRSAEKEQAASNPFGHIYETVSQCGEFEVRIFAPAVSEANFKFVNRTRNIDLPVTFLNLKFVRSPLQNGSNFRFR